MEEVGWKNLPWYSKFLYWITYQVARIVPSYGYALRKALQVEADLNMIHALTSEELNTLRNLRVTFPRGIADSYEKTRSTREGRDV